MTRPSILVLLLATLGLTSCASIVSDSVYPVSINSSPSGASFKIFDEDNQLRHTGTTPTTVMLDADGGYFDGVDYRIQFFQDGTLASERVIESDLDMWYLFGNIVFGGLIGWFIVDPITGAMWEYDSSFAVDLAPGAAAAAVSPE